MSKEHQTRSGYPNLRSSSDTNSEQSRGSYGDLSLYIEGFLLKHRAQKHSARTIEFYQHNLEKFHWFLHENRHPTNLLSITAAHIRVFLIYLQEEPGETGRWGSTHPSTRKSLAPTSVHGFARSLRAFFRWATKEADLPKNPFSLVDMPSLPNKWQITVFTDEEVMRLFAACEQFGLPFTVARNRCILAILLDSGIRAGELLALQIGDVDPNEGFFTVRGKGSKQRAVAIGHFARRELWTYLNKYRLKLKAPFPQLWVSHHGVPITYAGLRTMFDKLKKTSGITRVPVHPHVCRHSAATTMYRNGMRGSSLQEFLGHQQFDTTRRYYLNISREDLIAEHERYGPLDHIRSELRLEDGSGSRARAAEPRQLPSAEILAKEVAKSSYRAVARTYRVSDTTIRNRLKEAGLL